LDVGGQTKFSHNQLSFSFHLNEFFERNRSAVKNRIQISRQKNGPTFLAETERLLAIPGNSESRSL
jgi:hypothetical protein